MAVEGRKRGGQGKAPSVMRMKFKPVREKKEREGRQQRCERVSC